MERIISVEEKVRRAEEIYARRKNNYIPKERIENTVRGKEKKNFKLLKKIIIQILICALIYCIFYLIKNTNYLFSETTLNKIDEVLSYDINLKEIYENINEYLRKINSNTVEENSKEKDEIEESKEKSFEEETLSANDMEVQENTSNVELEITDVEEEPKSQMQLDAEYILQNFSIIKPIEGVITSEFGERESSNPIVTPNHIGIDIAANLGAEIKASMDGKVTVASYNSSYGNFLKIENGEIMTVYAHCKSLYVKEEQEVKQGQIIALVGSTGNSTGPHLHFEVRRQERFINPRYVIDF